MFMLAPSAVNCSAICIASSLVGVSTMPNMPQGSSDHLVSMGPAKAMVLPEPVLAPPMQSRPLRISGMQCFWISVGWVIFMAERDSTSHFERPSDLKLDEDMAECWVAGRCAVR